MGHTPIYNVYGKALLLLSMTVYRLMSLSFLMINDVLYDDGNG